MKKTLLLILFGLQVAVPTKQANAQWVHDSVSFESPADKIVIDTVADNLWQIGQPGKEYFNAAHSGIKAIVTDSLNSYPVNNESSFIYIIRNPYTQTCITTMEFWHKYDTDTLNDIGTIDASYDGGNSWVLVSDTSTVAWNYSIFWWDYDYHESTHNYTPHALAISGKSDGWILSKFNWQWFLPVKLDTIIPNPDSLMIRFTFTSDSVAENKEGWMIDDILTSSGDGQICSNTKDIFLENNVSVYPNPFSSYATLQFKDILRNGTITLHNSYGRIVNEITNVSGREVAFYRNGLPPGMYLLHLTENGKLVAVKRLIICD